MEARKDDGIDGKGELKLRFDLIPIEPLREVARVYTIGSKKYEDRNWEKGLKWGRVYAAMVRHATAWWSGERFDPVDGQNHLASVVWAAMALMEYENTHPELDDRPKHYVDDSFGCKVYKSENGTEYWVSDVERPKPYIDPKVKQYLDRMEKESKQKNWCKNGHFLCHENDCFKQGTDPSDDDIKPKSTGPHGKWLPPKEWQGGV